MLRILVRRRKRRGMMIVIMIKRNKIKTLSNKRSLLRHLQWSKLELDNNLDRSLKSGISIVKLRFRIY